MNLSETSYSTLSSLNLNSLNGYSLDDLENHLARKYLKDFSLKLDPTLVFKPFHNEYYELLTLFAFKKIKKLIVTIPPQHGKSEGSTRKLPAFLYGINPDLKIAIGSYSGTFAQEFNRDIQRIIDSETYSKIFPNTKLNGANVVTVSTSWLRNSTVFEIVNHKGSLRAIGRGGALTGKSVDVMIMDDLYKDYAEGNSPLVRQAVIDWYISVVLKRLHNDSQQLIVFTRWHEEDLIGYIESKDTVVEIKSIKELETLDLDRVWVKINFEAIKESDPTEIDPRKKGEALWEERHSKVKLEAERKFDPLTFECMNQGNPSSKEGMLYSKFKTYERIDNKVIKKANYTDTADEGDCFTCSVCYDKDIEGYIYITDIVYSQDPMEETEKTVPMMLNRNKTRTSYVESNNGGKGFARAIERKLDICEVEWFAQKGNKESRILTNSATVNHKVLMPIDWEQRWPTFASHLKKYKRQYNANKYHDAPDVLTGIVEKEFLSDENYGVSRRN